MNVKSILVRQLLEMLEIYAGHTGLDGGQKPKNDQFLYSGFIICIKQERKKQLSRSENEKLKMT